MRPTRVPRRSRETVRLCAHDDPVHGPRPCADHVQFFVDPAPYQRKGHGGALRRLGWRLLRVLALQSVLRSREGKGRPAGLIELRVSPSPSKIPYGGFSPVRLQMDRQWRPSTTAQGLSAVHIRPVTPSYTPPQQQLPGIRDPEGTIRSRVFRFNVARSPATETRPPRGPWLAIGLCCPDRSSLTTASSEPLNSSPPLMVSRRGLLHPRKSAFRWESRGSPIYSVRLCSRAASLTPVTPMSANDCCFLLGFSLHLLLTGFGDHITSFEATTLMIRETIGIVMPVSWLSPPFEDVLIRNLRWPGHLEPECLNIMMWINSQLP